MMPGSTAHLERVSRKGYKDDATYRSLKGKSRAHKTNLDAEKGDPEAESKVGCKKISNKEAESHRQKCSSSERATECGRSRSAACDDGQIGPDDRRTLTHCCSW